MSTSATVVTMRAFWLSANTLEGSMPAILGTGRVSTVKGLEVDVNKLTGSIPEAIGRMRHLIQIWMQSNRLAGSIPDAVGGAGALLTAFVVDDNSLSGEAPAQIGRMQNLIYFYVSRNFLTGSLPQHVMQLTRVSQLWVHRNSLEGNVLEQLHHLPELSSLRCEINMFGGTLTKELSQLLSLKHLVLDHNSFAGDVPVATAKLVSLRDLELHSNDFGSSLPEAIGQLCCLTRLAIQFNHFTNSLPEGLSRLQSLSSLLLESNRFSGVLPEALCTLRSISMLTADYNFISGTVPSAFGQLRKARSVFLDANALQGSLPDAIGRLQSLYFLTLRRNKFIGTLPPGLGQRYLHLLLLGGTRLEGSIPRTLGGRQWPSAISLRGLSLAGTVPQPYCQQDPRAHMLVVLGHGLAGYVPRLCGTLWAMSIFGNSFHGELPEVALDRRSILLAHNNYLSCRMPINGNTAVNFSLGLYGNRISEPRKFPHFPSWVQPHERSDRFFCVSDKDSWHLLLRFVAGSAVFTGILLYYHRVLGHAIMQRLWQYPWTFYGKVAILVNHCMRGMAKLFLIANVFIGFLFNEERVYTCQTLLSRVAVGGRSELATLFLVTAFWVLQCCLVAALLAMMRRWSKKRKPWHLRDQRKKSKSTSISRLPSLRSLPRPGIPTSSPSHRTAAASPMSGSVPSSPCLRSAMLALSPSALSLRISAAGAVSPLTLRGRSGSIFGFPGSVPSTPKACVGLTAREHSIPSSGSIASESGSSHSGSDDEGHPFRPGRRGSCSSDVRSANCQTPQAFVARRTPELSLQSGLPALNTARAPMAASELGDSPTLLFPIARVDSDSIAGETTVPNVDRQDDSLQGPLQTTVVWLSWGVVVLGICAPGALYSALKVIPGFMTDLGCTRFIIGLLNHGVSLFNAILTAFAIPALARHFNENFRARGQKEGYLDFGKLMAVWLVPCGVTLVFHDRCCGMWVTWWKACRSGHLDIQDSVTSILRIDGVERLVKVDLNVLSRSDVCATGGYSIPHCMHSIINNFSVLILHHLVHLTFFIPCLHLLGMGETASYHARMLVVLLLELSVVFVPHIPLILAIACAAIGVHSFILCAGLRAGSYPEGDAGVSVHPPALAACITGLCALFLQCCICWEIISLLFGGQSR